MAWTPLIKKMLRTHIMPILNFNQTVALTGMIIVFYTNDVLTKIVDNNTRNRTFVDKLVIVSAINSMLVIMLTIGWWKNAWLRAKIKLKSFDDTFSRLVLYVGVANTLLFVLKYYYDNVFLATIIYAVIMFPIIAASNYGYALEIKRLASK